MLIRFLYPKISKIHILQILKFSVLGAMLAGLYGFLHDQITYSISHEYFTKLKFKQFWYADFGMGERFFVGTIGFLATWWVGFFIGWFLARWFVPKLSTADAKRAILRGFSIVFGFGLSFALLAGIYGLVVTPSPNLEGWSYTLRYYGVSDGWSFVRVAYIHNGSYLGGLVGLVVSIVVLDRQSKFT